MHGLKHYQELRDMCQQDVVSLSFKPAAFNSYLLACLPDYKWEDRPSKEVWSKTTSPFLVSEESGPSLFPHQQRTFLFTDSLLNKTVVNDYYVPDTTEQNHPWAGRAHSVMEKADHNQIITQINDYFQTLMRTIKAPWLCVIGDMT